MWPCWNWCASRTWTPNRLWFQGQVRVKMRWSWMVHGWYWIKNDTLSLSFIVEQFPAHRKLRKYASQLYCDKRSQQTLSYCHSKLSFWFLQIKSWKNENLENFVNFRPSNATRSLRKTDWRISIISKLENWKMPRCIAGKSHLLFDFKWMAKTDFTW